MMKKNVWAPLLAAALLLLGSCGYTESVPAPTPEPTPIPTEKLVPGRWVCADVDVSADFAALFPAGDVSLSDICEFPDVCADLELCLGEDGSYCLAYNGEDSRRAAENVMAALKEGVRDYLLSAMGEAYVEAGMKPEAVRDVALLESTMAMTLEELYAHMGLEELVGSWEREMGAGCWSVQDGVLRLDETAAEYDAAADSITFEGRVYMRR